MKKLKNSRFLQICGSVLALILIAVAIICTAFAIRYHTLATEGDMKTGVLTAGTGVQYGTYQDEFAFAALVTWIVSMFLLKYVISAVWLRRKFRIVKVRVGRLIFAVISFAISLGCLIAGIALRFAGGHDTFETTLSGTSPMTLEGANGAACLAFLIIGIVLGMKSIRKEPKDESK